MCFKYLYVCSTGVLKLVIEKCVENASVKEICEYSDQLLFEDTSNCFKKIKDMKKGIAFPTCISVNNCICHYSPLKSDPDLILKREDVVKIDLGEKKTEMFDYFANRKGEKSEKYFYHF